MTENTNSQVIENEDVKVKPMNIAITLILFILICIIVYKTGEGVSKAIVNKNLMYDEFEIHNVTIADDEYSWSLKAEETDGDAPIVMVHTVYNAECTLVNNRLSYTYVQGDAEKTTISLAISDETRDRIIKDLEDNNAKDIYIILISRVAVLRR